MQTAISKSGINYKEVSSPAAKLDTIEVVLLMAAHNFWLILQLDAKSVVLHSELQEQV